MICRDMKAVIKNVEHVDSTNKFVVARSVDCLLWYYGRYETAEKAFDVAKEIGGIVVIDDLFQISSVKMSVDCTEDFIKHNNLSGENATRCRAIGFDQIKESIGWSKDI